MKDQQFWRTLDELADDPLFKERLQQRAAHRQGVSPVYNSYARVGSDVAFAGRKGDYEALVRPLFML